MARIEISEIPGDVSRILSERAAETGTSLDEFVKAHLVSLATDLAGTIEFEYQDRLVRMPDPGGFIPSNYRAGRFYEGGMLAAIAELQLSGNYVDVGANIGNHTLFFEMFCPSDRVLAFEPTSRPFEFLMRTRKENDLHFEAYDFGLSDRRETLEVTFNKVTSTIRTRPFDEMSVRDIAVIKIDVEGMEPKVLAGMEQTLRVNSPHLYIEAHNEEEVRRQEALIEPLGYTRTGRVWNPSPTHEWVKKPKRRLFGR